MGNSGREQSLEGAGMWEDGVRHSLGLEASSEHLDEVILKSSRLSNSY